MLKCTHCPQEIKDQVDDAGNVILPAHQFGLQHAASHGIVHDKTSPLVGVVPGTVEVEDA